MATDDKKKEPRLPEEKKAAARERAAKARPMSVGNMEEVRKRRAEMMQRRSSVVG